MRRPEDVEPDQEADMTSMIFQVGHKPGALIRALEAFESSNINLTKLETYMIGQEDGNPTFFVDAGAGIHDPRMDMARESLNKAALCVRILGSYKSSRERRGDFGYLPVANDS